MELFSSVKSGNISELIARQIKSAIENGKMKQGDRLPPERDMAEQFQTSRVSVREAIKSLQAAGLLTIKRGSGVYAAGISSKPMTDSLSSILKIQKTSINELIEARIIIEPNIVRLATERITPEDFQQLDNNIAEASRIIRSNASASSINIEFHSIIARATHNLVIALTMENMFNVTKEWFLKQSGDSTKMMKLSRQSLLYHKRILEALRERDSQKVYELMLKHTLLIKEHQHKLQRSHGT